MKNLLAVLVLFGALWSTPVEAAWVKEQSCVGSLVASANCTISSVGPGHTLVLAVKLSIGGPMTVTSPGLTWIRDASRTHAGLGWIDEVWSLPNTPPGTIPITVTSTGGATAIRIILNEFSGLATTSWVDKTVANSGTGSAVNTGSVTTTVDNDTLFVVAGTDSDLLGWSPGPGYTIRNRNCSHDIEPDQKICVEDRGPVPIGTYSGTFTITPDSWVAILVAYKPSGGGGR